MALIEHLEKLRHFKKISQYGSIKSAAQASGMSQAGLSKSLSSLEDILGVQLIARSISGIRVTKEGELLLKATEKILAEAEKVEAEIKTLDQSQAPQFLRIGMYDSIAVYFFNSLSDYLNRNYPKLGIELVVDRSPRLFKLIESGDIDISFAVTAVNEINFQHPIWPVYEDQFSFFMNVKCVDYIDQKPLIIYPDAMVNLPHFKRMTMEEYFVSKKNLGRKIHRVYNFETVKALTDLRVGIGVMPNLVAEPLVAARRLVRVAPKHISQFFGAHQIVMCSEKTLSQKHTSFLQDLRRIAQDWAKT